MGETAREEMQGAGDVGDEEAGVTRTAKRPEDATEETELVLALGGGRHEYATAGSGAERASEENTG